MNIHRVLNSVKDKSGTLCAIAAVAGVFVTAYLSGKAAVRAKEEIKPDMDKKEKMKKTAIIYAKTAVSAVATSALIIGSDRIHVGKEAALAGAVAFWKTRLSEEDKAIHEKLGDEEFSNFKNDIVKKKIEEHPYDGPMPNPELREILVYEPYTDQYIVTTQERISWAMLSANKRLQTKWDVRMNYIIKLLGGKATPEGDEIGWNWENEMQEEAWSYYGGPWIELVPDVRRSDPLGALTLFYMVDPATQTPEDMIYSET